MADDLVVGIRLDVDGKGFRGELSLAARVFPRMRG